VGSRVSSVTSRSSESSSSTTSAKVKATATRAILEAEAAALQNLYQIELEELRLQQRKKELQLKTNIAKAEAEELAYSNIETSPSEFKNKLPDRRGNPVKQERTDDALPSLKPRNPNSYNDRWAADSKEVLLRYMIESQQRQNQNIQQLLQQQQQQTLALTLPQPEVPHFSGDPIDYCNFIRAFENLIEGKTANGSARLYYLVQYTTGDVRELVRSCLTLNGEEGYTKARKLLKERYGQSYRIATAYVDRLVKGPPIKAEDNTALQRFAILLTSCNNTLKEIGYQSKVENPDSLKRIVDRLSYGLRQKWRDVADRITEREEREISIEDITAFVVARARAAAHPIFGNLSGETQKSHFDHGKPRSHKPPPKGTSSFATQGNQPVPTRNDARTLKCPSCNGNHWLSRCVDFKKMSLEERHTFVRNKNVCSNCLVVGHQVNSCPRSSFCRIENCESKHSTYLHPKSNDRSEIQQREAQPTASLPQGNMGMSNHTARNGYINIKQSKNDQKRKRNQATALAIVPVKVRAKGNGETIDTYAFLDSGSNTTFCTDRLMKRLNLKGEKTILSLTTMERERSESTRSIVSLEILDLSETNLVELPMVFTSPSLPVTTENMACQQDIAKWEHLQGIKIPQIEAEIDLLIGSDVPEALQPEEVRKGRNGQPYATRTILGWVVNGPLGREHHPNHIASAIKTDVELSQQFEGYCNREFNDSSYDGRTSMSQEDKRAVEIMETSVVLKQGHYELALPWKHYPPCLQNNKQVAEHRLKLLQRRLAKNPELLRMYSDFINDLLRKGFARKVPNESLNQAKVPVWYLPHHPVFHPQKPGKVRVVFDCSAKYKGSSLNDQLLQGPDLTNTLVGVLTRFRQEPVAFMSDVEAMFLQVRVRDEDCDTLRFLWWPGGDVTGQPQEYQMTVHLFGAASSPSCANFALRKTAVDNSEEFDQETVDTVKQNFYVDDCLKSVATEQEATRLSEQLRKLLSKGGFRLTKWLSNSPSVLQSIPESERAPSSKNLDFERLHVERALGVQWNVSSDKFGFKIATKDKPATRRGILSMISSVYDPLGFAAPFTLPPKMLLQDLCRKKLGWDDAIPEEDAQRWKTWLKDLPKLEQLDIDRCFKPKGFGEVISSQLHHFADASQQGYGAVSYLRSVNSSGDIHCSFVTGKARVAPIKPLTVPRMELSAAVLATRLDKMIQQELTTPLTSKSTFWTDSTCVLRYIENEDKRFQTFVANRVAMIHDASSHLQWRYVDTKSNPADDASRGLWPEDISNNCRWISGAEFLWHTEETWPQRPADMQRIKADDPEVKKEAISLAVSSSHEYDLLTNIFNRFSSWNRLQKFVAWMMRYKARLREACKRRRLARTPIVQGELETEPISIDEMKAAENAIVKYVQKQGFQEEICALSQGRILSDVCIATVSKSSSIYKLDPVLVAGILRVGGRLNNAPIGNDSKHQVLLPKRHHIVELIVRHYHHMSGHSGLEYVLSQIRQRFWIIQARVTIRRILKACFNCRRRQAPVGEQKMASLPKSRVTPFLPAFSFVGVDCFGPILVKRGRSTVKRYGALYTCMTTRAVHIEIIHSLDTDSFINSMRRFMSRRGIPKEIRSDNGGNFVKGERELREAIGEWNQQKIHETLLQRNVKWVFNPPAGSHHGGVWERCIRSARKVMQSLIKEQTLHDEGLVTLMCEVEAILNGRPLTKVSDDPNDMEALTPNHLLLLQPGNNLPPGVFRKEDSLLHKRWRQVQYLANVFWRRWLKEYLPSLQERQKWGGVKRNFAVNDIVLVRDDNASRASWPLGRILEVYYNRRDGLVRSVKLKTKTSVLVRPIDKIVLLEAAEN
jgi:hypothetical protein